MDLRIEPYPTQGQIRWVEPLVTVATNDLFQKKNGWLISNRTCAQISFAVLCRIKLVENSKPATRLQAPQKNDCLPDYHGDFHPVLLGSPGLLGKTFPRFLGAPWCTEHQGPNPTHPTEAPMRSLFKALLPPESIFCGSSMAVTASMPSWRRWGHGDDDRVPHGNNGSLMVQETKNWINSSENLMGHGITRECLGSLSGSLSANLSHQQPIYKSPMRANLTVIIDYWGFLLAGLVESPRYLAPNTSY